MEKKENTLPLSNPLILHRKAGNSICGTVPNVWQSFPFQVPNVTIHMHRGAVLSPRMEQLKLNSVVDLWFGL